VLKADLHIHTCYSDDSDNSLDDIINRCLKIGINCLAVCDHGTIEGAVKLQKIAPFKIIVAEEILTPNGEIMGMFLQETIPSGMTPQETIKRIREQGGLVCIPHPFDKFRSSALQMETLELIKEEIDIIEVLNGRMAPFQNRDKGRLFAEENGFRQSAGSDAHSIPEIGACFVEMPDFNGKEDFLNALDGAKIKGYYSNPLVKLVSLKNKLKKRFV